MTRVINAARRILAGLIRPSRRGNLRRLRQRGESAADLLIRDATAPDITALARLHVITWNGTYAPFGLKGPSVEVRERQWRAKFAQDDPDWFCLLVQRRTESWSASRRRTGANQGELAKIHLLRGLPAPGLGTPSRGTCGKTLSLPWHHVQAPGHGAAEQA